MTWKGWENYEPPVSKKRISRDRDQHDDVGSAVRSVPASNGPGQGQRRKQPFGGGGSRGARVKSDACYYDPATEAILEPALAKGLEEARAAAGSQDPALEYFQSKREARRYVVLCGELRAGRIHGLRRQVRFPLNVRRPDGIEETIAHWRCDFEYFEDEAPARDTAGRPDVRPDVRSRRIVEDCKGFRTEMYRRSKRHFEAQYGIKIKET